MFYTIGISKVLLSGRLEAFLQPSGDDGERLLKGVA